MCSGTVQANEILEYIEVQHGQNANIVQIHFTQPIRYVDHGLSDDQRSIVVNLNQQRRSSSLTSAISRVETLSWAATADVPLSSVRYEYIQENEAAIYIQFTQPVSVDIRQSDLITLSVTLKKQGTITKPLTTPATLAEKPVQQKPDKVENSKYLYVINLLSSYQEMPLPYLPNIPELGNSHLYTTTYQQAGKQWYRVRLGFFQSREEAKQIIFKISKDFPGSWVDLVKKNEQSIRSQWVSKLDAKDITSQTKPAPQVAAAATKKVTATPANNDTKLAVTENLLNEAKEKLTDKDYRAAIRLLTKLLNMGEHTHSAEAQELLGLARERNGQLAHAKAEYETYLSKYPDGEGSTRVRQRLLSIVTARTDPKEQLKKGQRSSKKAASEWFLFGSAAQFFRHDVNTTDLAKNVVTDSSLYTDFDYSGRQRRENVDLRTRLSVSHRQSFLDDDDDPSELRISNLYFEANSRDKQYRARIGRQSQNTGGVLGRFDGVGLSMQLNSQWRFDLTSGFPVQLTESNDLETSRYFYGANLNYGTFAQYWDVSFFAIEQIADGITDRQAIGSELRYLHPQQSLFTLVDYDVSYNQLNTALLIGTQRVDDFLSLSVVLDHRKSPILTTSNALQGQLSEDLEDLLTIFDEDSVRELAQDRTTEFNSATLSATFSTSERLQLITEIATANLKGTPESGGIPANPDTGDEVYFTVQLIGSNLFSQSDISIAGIRLAKTQNSDRFAVNLRSRFQLNPAWRLDPRLHVEQQVRTDDTNVLTLRPEIRSEYKRNRKLKFEFIVGYEQTEFSGSTIVDRDEESIFSTAGFLYIF